MPPSKKAKTLSLEDDPLIIHQARQSLAATRRKLEMHGFLVNPLVNCGIKNIELRHQELEAIRTLMNKHEIDRNDVWVDEMTDHL